MNPPFPLLQQPLGSKSCLPTCVRAVLRWYGQIASLGQVSEWCREAAGGCEFFVTLQSLQDEGFDVMEVDDEDTLLEMFAGEDPEPVIVMLRTPNMAPNSDHAVVIHAIGQQGENPPMIDYMDPIDGVTRQNTDGSLLRWWNINGSRAFLIRP